MGDGNDGKKSQPPLVDNILQYGKQAFDPEESDQTRKSSLEKFNDLLRRCVTV